MDVPNSSFVETSSLTYSTASEYISSPTTSSDEILPQSGNVPFTVVPSPNDNHQTSGFDSINPGYTYDVGDMSDDTRGAADSGLGLDEFFHRPIRLYGFVWQVGTPFYQTFNPVQAFMNQKRVANRISNYKNMRGRLHLRFLINGSPFNRGLMIVHARPFPLNDAYTLVRALVPADRIAASQMPHIYLNPTTSQGGDLVLPFFWPYNTLDLTGTQMLNTWELIIRDMSALQNSIGSAACTIQILAWMEEIVLSSPTDHNVLGIAPQSGEEDEYGNKPASAMASSVARASGALVDAPIIGKYMRATQMAAKAVGSVANVFGYSRPISLEPRMGVETLNIGSLSNYNLPDATVKLSLDAKKELVVDPRVTGLGPQDEMHIATTAMRESYIASFAWTEGDAAGHPIFYAAVTPSHFAQSAGGEIHMTPSCWACVPFQFWRGSMRFRFKVIASNFHKGRLRITYDPVFSRINDDFNVVQNHIFDIAETKDFTVQVGWSSDKPYLVCADLESEYFSAIPLTVNPDTQNGSIRVEVFTNLTTADPAVNVEAVEVLMFTSACDDFEVASPRTALMASLSYNKPPDIGGRAAEILPQSGDELLGEGTQEPDIPVKDTVESNMGGGSSPTLQLNDICFGESIVSWKQCLQRYCFHHCFKSCIDSNVSVIAVANHYRPDFPITRGYQSDGVHTSVDGAYNYTYMTLMNWITPAYVGWRGAIRWKYMIPVSNGAPLNKTIQVHRSASNNGWVDNALTINVNGSTGSAMAEFMCRALTGTWNGAHIVSSHLNNVCSVELPYYQALRFQSARRKDMMTANNEFRSHSVNVMSMDPQDTLVMAYVSAGEDFTCHFFLGIPVVWQYSNPTAV